MTTKGMNRIKMELLKRFKTFLLSFRSVLETRRIKFYHDHWLLFYQPENLTKTRKERLGAFLEQHPSLRVYRELTLYVGAIYRRNPKDIPSNFISRLKNRSSYSQNLQTAIKTLKRYQRSILRFVDVFTRHPDLPKAARANVEHLNPRAKAPFRAGRNCTSSDNLKRKLELQLGCEVRFFSEKMVAV